MEILDSLEVRWFLQKDSPAATPLNAWFQTTTPEKERIDHYLVTGRSDLGFKARKETAKPLKVETKYLVESPGPVPFAAGVVGTLERWRKLSITVDDPDLRRDGKWLTVYKIRQLKKFDYANGVATEVPVEERPDAGCGFELTELRFGFESAEFPITDAKDLPVEWTLGLEAFGPDHLLLEILQTTCRTAFGEDKPLHEVELGANRSMSYPSWLQATADQYG